MDIWLFSATTNKIVEYDFHIPSQVRVNWSSNKNMNYQDLT